MRLVLLRLLAKGAHCSQHAQLLVVANNSRDGGAGGGGGGGGLLPPLTSFVDMGVYTRNRCVCFKNQALLQVCVVSCSVVLWGGWGRSNGGKRLVGWLAG